MVLESNNEQIHFVLFPFMAHGHMIPMMDLAKLLAQRGVMVTMVTTHRNAGRIEASLERAVICGLSIQMLKLAFPWEQVGLPEGCEGVDMLPNNDMFRNFFTGAALLQAPAEKALAGMTPPPTCLISDHFLPWTMNLATKFGIPRITFNTSSIFFHTRNQDDNDNAYHQAEFTQNEPHFLPLNDDPDTVFKKFWDADRAAFETIFNSFEELESGYADVYEQIMGNKAWCIGTVSLCNENELDKSKRGNNGGELEEEHACLKWLDSCSKGSLVYACMGSMCPLTPSQMLDLGSGLEASGKPFVWAIRTMNGMEEVVKLIKEDGLEDRVQGRGMLILGWAPQLLILSHPAIGAFLTHCRWNSTLEGICAGLPLITLPVIADQFANQKLVEQVFKAGVGVNRCVEENLGVSIQREDVKRAIRKVMNEGQECEEMRKRVQQLREMAKTSIKEGGSSHNNLSMLITNVVNMQLQRKKT